MKLRPLGNAAFAAGQPYARHRLLPSRPRAAAEPPPAPPAQPGATTFADFARQPAVLASEDAVSTFSLDVDRTSYFLALEWARTGYNVEPDSVRAEEWVNAFDYGYQPPSDEWGFGVGDQPVGPPSGPRQAARAHRIPGAAPAGRQAAQRHARAGRLRLHGERQPRRHCPRRRRGHPPEPASRRPHRRRPLHRNTMVLHEPDCNPSPGF